MDIINDLQHFTNLWREEVKPVKTEFWIDPCHRSIPIQFISDTHALANRHTVYNAPTGITETYYNIDAEIIRNIILRQSRI